MKKEKYILMGIFGAIASATRNTGIMLVFAIVPYAIVKYIKEKQENKFSIKGLFLYIIKQPKLIFGTCLVPLGLFLFMLFLYFKTGDGLAFVHIQRAWRVTDTNFIENILNRIKRNTKYWVLFGAMGYMGNYLSISFV